MWLLENVSVSGINARKVSTQHKREPGMVWLHTCDPNTEEAEDPQFKASLGYVADSRPTWGTWDLSCKKEEGKLW